jgi:hypothetical protein
MFQVAPCAQASPPKPCVHGLFPPYMPHSTPIGTEIYASSVYDEEHVAKENCR